MIKLPLSKNADFRRFTLLLEIPAFGGRRKPQKTADFRRKPKIFAENRRKPQIGLRHLRCVTFSSAPINRYEKWFEKREIGSERWSKTCPNIFKPLPRRLNFSLTGTFLKVFRRPKVAQTKTFFHPEALQG